VFYSKKERNKSEKEKEKERWNAHENPET